MALTALSCKKDDNSPSGFDIRSTTWSDSANVGGIPYKPFSISFNADGTAKVTFSGYSPFPGSWNKPFTHDTVFFFFDENATTTWKGVGVFGKNNTEIKGTLTRTAPSTITGTFTVKKQ